MATVTIVEDDADLRGTIRRGLVEEGLDVTAVGTAAELLQRIEGQTPDALIIDIGLPDADGRDVCQAIRALGIPAPVLFLTARGALTDRLSGFHVGGDDYLTKPFAFQELLVRLQALLRRTPADQRPATGDLVLDPVQHAVAVGGRGAAALTPTEYRILAVLAARPGDVVRRRELIVAAWPDGAIVRDNTLDAYIARLRRKLRELGREDAIATVHGVGYRLR